jgi:pyrrolysine biosynthesis protein PylC
MEMVPEKNYCIYEHLLLENGNLRSVGEHVLSQGDEYVQFHVSEGLDIFESRGKNKKSVFTLISWGSDRETTEKMRQNGMEMITEHFQKNPQEV